MKKLIRLFELTLKICVSIVIMLSLCVSLFVLQVVW